MMEFDRKSLLKIQDSKALEAITELRGFWRLKGYYLSLKCYPRQQLYQNEYEEILTYLARYTQLLTVPAFKFLTKTQFITFCKCLSMRGQETCQLFRLFLAYAIDDRNMKLRVNCLSERQSELCILLTGIVNLHITLGHE